MRRERAGQLEPQFYFVLPLGEGGRERTEKKEMEDVIGSLSSGARRASVGERHGSQVQHGTQNAQMPPGVPQSGGGQGLTSGTSSRCQSQQLPT